MRPCDWPLRLSPLALACRLAKRPLRDAGPGFRSSLHWQVATGSHSAACSVIVMRSGRRARKCHAAHWQALCPCPSQSFRVISVTSHQCHSDSESSVSFRVISASAASASESPRQLSRHVGLAAETLSSVGTMTRLGLGGLGCYF